MSSTADTEEPWTTNPIQEQELEEVEREREGAPRKFSIAKQLSQIEIEHFYSSESLLNGWIGENSTTRDKLAPLGVAAGCKIQGVSAE
jgi:hypothetical protein